MSLCRKNRARSPGGSVPPPDPPAAAAGPGSAPAAPPALYVVATGHGSPCLDLRRVSRELAEACSGVDLIVIEGMGEWLGPIYAYFSPREGGRAWSSLLFAFLHGCLCHVGLYV